MPSPSESILSPVSPTGQLGLLHQATKFFFEKEHSTMICLDNWSENQLEIDSAGHPIVFVFNLYHF